MKPWEETWSECDGVISAQQNTHAEMLESRFPWEQGTNFGAFGDLTEASPFNPTSADADRARLAAAAPEMVRVLLAIEWSGSDEEGSKCASCGEREYAPPALYDEAGKYLSYTPGSHSPDCALDAALRKAGVR